MATPFARTTRALAHESSRFAYLSWALALALLTGWGIWFATGGVTVYAVSRSARLEVQQSAHALAPAVAGKIEDSRLVLGQSVRAGEVLVRLDARHEQLRLREEQSRLDAYAPRLASLRREIQALRQASAEDAQTALAAARIARLRAAEAATGVEFAREQESRLLQEARVGGVAQIEALRASAETRKLGAASDALAAEVGRLESDTRSRARQQQAQIENLERSAIDLESARSTTQAGIERLAQDIEQTLVRAPVDGVLGEVAALRAGSFLSAGQKLASVVPQGDFVVVADFAPAAVLGRIRPGQRARMRLDGFPWTAYGSIDARVSRVASEIRDQSVRVEFSVQAAADSRIAWQHGLPGVVEVSVDQTSPAWLLLRALGQVAPPEPSAQSVSTPGGPPP